MAARAVSALCCVLGPDWRGVPGRALPSASLVHAYALASPSSPVLPCFTLPKPLKPLLHPDYRARKSLLRVVLPGLAPAGRPAGSQWPWGCLGPRSGDLAEAGLEFGSLAPGLGRC